jgi:uncharacterized coiled-coil protein SlyX
MSQPPTELLSQLSQRVTSLEMLVTHLERTIHELDEALRERGKQLDHVERSLAQLRLEVGVLREGPAEIRSPEEEKPPHY